MAPSSVLAILKHSKNELFGREYLPEKRGIGGKSGDVGDGGGRRLEVG